jgi:hypothetical protein
MNDLFLRLRVVTSHLVFIKYFIASNATAARGNSLENSASTMVTCLRLPVDLAGGLINIAKGHGAKENIINDLLNSKTMNHGLAMKPRKYSDILVGQFEIGKIIRVNRKNDQHTISDKVFDFSRKTINELRESGYNNTMDLSDVEFS